MSDKQELKLACLHQAGGNLEHAKSLFAWLCDVTDAENMVGQAYQIVGVLSAYDDDGRKVEEAEWIRALEYLAEGKYDPTFLPWPREFATTNGDAQPAGEWSWIDERTKLESDVKKAADRLLSFMNCGGFSLPMDGESAGLCVQVVRDDKPPYGEGELSANVERPSVTPESDRADHNSPNDTEGGGEAVQIPEGFVRLSEPTDSVEAIANLRREVKSDNFLMFTERGQIVRPCIGNAGINETVDGFMHEGGRIIAYHYELPKKLYTFEEALIDERGYVDFSKPRADLERTEVDSPAQASTE